MCVCYAKAIVPRSGEVSVSQRHVGEAILRIVTRRKMLLALFGIAFLGVVTINWFSLRQSRAVVKHLDFPDGTEKDLGAIQEGSNATAIFRITNASSKIVTIEPAVKTSCGCTHGKISQEKLCPGETAELRLDITGDGPLGPAIIVSNVVVRSSDFLENLKFVARLNRQPMWLATPERFDVTGHAGQEMSLKLELKTVGPLDHARLRSLEFDLPNATVVGGEPGLFGREGREVFLNFTMPALKSATAYFVRVQTDCGSGVRRIPLWLMPSPLVQAVPPAIIFNLAGSESIVDRDCVVSLSSLIAGVSVTDIKTDSDAVIAEIEKGQFSESGLEGDRKDWKLRVRFSGHVNTRLSGKIELKLSHLNREETLRIPYVVRPSDNGSGSERQADVTR